MARKKSITTPPDAAALLRYISGESPLAEADWIRRWAAADPDREASIEELRAAWTHDAPAAAAWDSANLWSRIETGMSAKSPSPQARLPRRSSGPIPLARLRDAYPSSIRRVTSAIAAFAVLAAIATTVIRVRHEASPGATQSAMREIVTARGEMATLSLADGSTVTLAPGSRLRIPTEFGAVSREAVLDGQAVFTVKHDAARPFRVRTRGGVTEDIGTRFLVRAYTDDSTEVVAVTEGAVALRDTRSVVSGAPSSVTVPVTLRAGDMAELRQDGTVHTRRDVAVAGYFAWTTRRLTFTHTPLTEAVRVLNRWYDLDIRLDPRLTSRDITADFSIESAPAMLRVLEIALGVRVEQHGRVVALHTL